jgi:hypothetical protein
LCCRAATPSSSDVTAALEYREGYVWGSGTFDRVMVDGGVAKALVIDGRQFQVGSDFVIRRALMRRAPYQFRPTLRLLELPDLEGFNDFAGSQAFFESSQSLGEVCRVIVIEQPR